MADPYAAFSTPQGAPQPSPADPYAGFSAPAAQPANDGGIMIRAGQGGAYADPQGNTYQPAGDGFFTDKSGKRFQVVQPTAWQDAQGNSSHPAQFDKFGNGIDAQGNILSPSQQQVAPVSGVQQAYADAGRQTPTLKPGYTPLETLGNNLSHGLRSFADTISGGFANKGEALASALAHPEYGGSMGDRFSAALDQQNDFSRSARMASPLSTAIGSGAGALGQGLAIPERAPILGGAALGGINAAGSARGGPLQQVEQAGLGTLTGGLLGGAARVAAGPSGVLAAAPASVETTVSPRTARYLGGLLGKPDPAMIAAQAAGKPVTTAEMLGSPGRTALAATARRPGTTGALVEATMNDRLEAVPHTILQDFQDKTGVSPLAARGDMEALAESNRAGKVRPAYDAALKQPVTMTPQLASVLQEPEVITAVNQAKRLVGTNATEAGLQVDPATGNTVVDPHTLQPVITQQPTAETLDQAKKFLAKGITRDPITREPVTSGPGAPENVFIQRHLGALTDALAGNADAGIPAAIPGYRQALDAAGDSLKMEQAFKLGQQHILNPNVVAADVKPLLSGMSPSEQEAYQGGQANALFTRAQNSTLNPKKLLTQNVRDKLAASVGPDKADAFVEAVGHTKSMVDNARQIAPQAGSQTAPLSAEIARQDSGGGLGAAIGDYVKDFGMGSVAGGPHVGFHLANLNAGRKAVGGLLSGISNAQMPVAVRNEVGGILGATGSDALTPEKLAQIIAASRQAGRFNVPQLPPTRAGLLAGPTTSFLMQSAQQ